MLIGKYLIPDVIKLSKFCIDLFLFDSFYI